MPDYKETTVLIKSNLKNLFVLAETAELSGNSVEAYNYYTKILEEDITNPKAWFGKGISAGWQSTIQNNRLSDMLEVFQKAIKYATDKEKYINKIAKEIEKFVLTYTTTLNNHLQEFVSVNNAFGEYSNECFQIIMCLEEYNAFVNADFAMNNPEIVDKYTLLNIRTVECLINICKYNIEGISYKDTYTEKMVTYTLTDSYRCIFKERFESLVLLAQKINPKYEIPKIVKHTNYIDNNDENDENDDESDSCFIATATMGNINHPKVVILRQFRDKVLLTTKIGKKFINCYYKIGPEIANFIKNRLFLRKLSYLLIVFPTSKIARTILIKRR